MDSTHAAMMQDIHPTRTLRNPKTRELRTLEYVSLNDYFDVDHLRRQGWIDDSGLSSESKDNDNGQ